LPKKTLMPSLLITVFLLFFLSSNVIAGISGKISGEVYDAGTGKPLVGASIMVLGTNIGTRTDDDGEYFIINLPVGKYDVSVSSVGYELIIKKDVRVLVDLTTPVDFEVDQQTIELGQEVIVYAEDQVIQRDLTASKVIFTSDRLKTLPNITSVQTVLTNYPGVVVDNNSNIHVRGGRTGEVTYYYDGYAVNDPFFSSAGIRIMPSTLEELSLTSGGYTAEYGEALSGVISAVTQEGGSEYHGNFKTYESATHAYDVNAGDWGNLSLSDSRSAMFNISGPIPGCNPKAYTFFAAGEYLKNQNSLPHNGAKSYTGSAKLTMQPTQQVKIKANATVYDVSGDTYNHRDGNGISYDMNLDGLPVFERKALLVGLSGHYSVNSNMILSANFSRFRTNTKVAPEHLMDVYWDQWPGYSVDSTGVYNGTIHRDNYLGGDVYDATNALHMTGFTTGDDFDPSYNWRESKYNAFNMNLLAQLNKIHELKTGFDIRNTNVEWDFKQFYNTQPYGEKYNSSPLIASAYLQDKMEYQDFVVNIGLRMDYRDADIAYNITPDESIATYKQADATWRLSPRLGVSFPVSDLSVMHFNYGLYYQVPQYAYMYTNLQGDIATGRPILGNPDLEPEQVISYELGLDHLIGDNLRVDVTAYFKDMRDLVTTRGWRIVSDEGTVEAAYYDNGDYGTVKGIDIALEKLPMGGYLSGSISYGYMIATGNGSYADEPYYTYLGSTVDSLAPLGEYPLNFDQRHTLTTVLDYRVPRNWRGNLFGMSIPGSWGVSMVGHYGSGLPYSPTNVMGSRLGERNEGRLPAYYTIDTRFSKGFYMGGNDNLVTAFVEVDNLFNRRNVLNVYSRTGQPDNDGNRVGAGLALSQSELDELDELYDHNPQNYSRPRTVRVGFEFNF